MMKSLNAAAYLRRSTTDQDESLGIQREVIERYARQQGYRIASWYQDDGISGDVEGRPDFQRMIADAESGKFSVILCRNKSRFCRFKASKAIRYLDLLDSVGVSVDTAEEGPVDVDDLGGMIITSVDSHANKKYLIDLSSNTIKGQHRQVEAGSIAGQRAPYGYDRMYVDGQGVHRQRVKVGQSFARPRDWRTILVPSDDLEIVGRVRWMFETYLSGEHGCRGIADSLNAQGIPAAKGGQWSQGTIRAMLRNQIYTGDYVWNRRRYGKYSRLADGNAVKRDASELKNDKARTFDNEKEDVVVVQESHEAIVERDLFVRVQKKMESRSRLKGNGSPRSTSRETGRAHPKAKEYILSGMAYCRHCGGKMHGVARSRKKNGKTYRYRKYACSTYDTKGRSQCKSNQVDAEELESRVIAAIVEAFQDDGYRSALEQSIRRVAKSRSDAKGSTRNLELKTTLARLDGEIEKLSERVAIAPDEIIDVLFKKLAEKKRQRDSIDAEIQNETRSPIDDSEGVVIKAIACLDSLAEVLQTAERSKVRSTFKELIESVHCEFETVSQGKRQIQRISRALITLRPASSESQGQLIAGTGFEPATSRL